jgi:hypothetical protein
VLIDEPADIIDFTPIVTMKKQATFGGAVTTRGQKSESKFIDEDDDDHEGDDDVEGEDNDEVEEHGNDGLSDDANGQMPQWNIQAVHAWSTAYHPIIIDLPFHFRATPTTQYVAVTHRSVV